MCNRSTNDPLIRLFLDRYNLNLLSIPRENVTIGDLYVYDGKRVSTPGSVKYFLDSPYRLPPTKSGESMADVMGKLSSGVKIKIGFGLLESFLIALGAGAVISKIKVGFEQKSAATIKFRFTKATRDSMDALWFGKELMKHRILEEHALFSEDYRYYLVTAVARSPAISVVPEDENSNQVNLDLEALKLADINLGLAIENSGEGEITFTGRKKLAFGVELYELVVDLKEKQLKLRMPEEVINVRTLSPLHVTPALIGGEEGDVFLNVD